MMEEGYNSHYKLYCYHTIKFHKTQHPSLATGPHPVAKGSKKSWSGHILSVSIIWGVNPRWSEKYIVATQLKTKSGTYFLSEPNFQPFFVEK